jgi:hypothetical protein
MDQPFIAFSPTRVQLLVKRGWRFTLMTANEMPIPEKGVIFVIVNGKKYRAKRKES